MILLTLVIATTSLSFVYQLFTIPFVWIITTTFLSSISISLIPLISIIMIMYILEFHFYAYGPIDSNYCDYIFLSSISISVTPMLILVIVVVFVSSISIFTIPLILLIMTITLSFYLLVSSSIDVGHYDYILESHLSFRFH